MLDAENSAQETSADTDDAATGAQSAPAKKAAAKKAPAKKAAAKKAPAKKATTKKAAAADAPLPLDAPEPEPQGEVAPAKKAAAKKAPAKKATTKKAATKKAAAAAETVPPAIPPAVPAEEPPTSRARKTKAPPAASLLFQPPEPTAAPARRKKAEPKADNNDTLDTPTAPAVDQGPAETADAAPETAPRAPRKRSRGAAKEAQAADQADQAPAEEAGTTEEPDSRGQGSDEDSGDDTGQSGNRRRRRRGGRRRSKSGSGNDGSANDTDDSEDDSNDRGQSDRGQSGRGSSGNDSGRGSSDNDGADGEPGTRRRRKRRRAGDDGDSTGDDPQNTVTKVRKVRTAEDEITSLHGSTRLEAKKQRRREGREAGRRRAPIVSEAEFLARREAVDRVMVIRQKKDLTQIAVLEDKVLVEHYVARESQTSLIGNVYLGRVQNVLPSMEAAFIDIGKGRNAVLYAGEVNWDTLGAKDGKPRKIEAVLKSGQPILVQVSKDPIGHKGARLTSQISLPGRFLVYVPDGTTSGISRKLPDTERNRLKTLLKEIVPDSAGVIVRTAAEGASEEELTRDVERLTARWADIEGKVDKGNAPQLLYGEPDLTLKVVRDLFTEDFAKLVVSGDEAWDVVDEYVKHVAPDLADRLERYDGPDSGSDGGSDRGRDGGRDAFAEYRIDEQIAKGLDRKVWLPSGGSLVIDRTEAMTVVDVNTGKFTGSGGNLEETVTKNNLEAAEEIVRQLRLRDIGGIIVVDFIDMVLESNRDLVLRRMVECLGRDRTRHQVAEVTSLGLVQMTRKRIGTGLLEAFSENCEHCQGRGLVIHQEPVEGRRNGDDDSRRGGGRRGGGGGGGGRNRGRGDGDGESNDSQDDHDSGSRRNGNRASQKAQAVPSPKDVAAVARPENADKPAPDEVDGDVAAAEPAPAVPAGTVKVTSRPARTRATRAQAAPTVESAAPATNPEPATRDAEPASVTAPSPSSAENGAPAAVKVTSRPARTRATRAQAAPTVESTPAPEPASVTPTVATPDPQPAEAAAAAPVVTSVRRRSASRPAGPPAGADPTDPTDGSSDGSSDGSGEDEAAPHVPVKKKGSRKR